MIIYALNLLVSVFCLYNAYKFYDLGEGGWAAFFVAFFGINLGLGINGLLPYLS